MYYMYTNITYYIHNFVDTYHNKESLLFIHVFLISMNSESSYKGGASFSQTP